MYYRGIKQIAILCYLLCFIALLVPLQTYAASAIDIIVKQRVLVAQERGIVTLPFTVVNRSSQTLNLSENINLPQGWRILATSGSFTLAPGERTVRLVHVLASSDVPSGSYTLPYHVISQDQLSIHAEENVSVVIASNAQLSLEVIEPPGLVLAGEEYTVKVTVKNKGNVAVSLTADIKDRLGYVASLRPKSLALEPSQSSTLTITAKIPASLKNTSYHTFKLSLEGRSIDVQKEIKTRIVSRIPEGIGRYHTLTAKVSGNYTSNGNIGTLQTELSVAGSLDEEGIHNIDLLVRNKQTLSTSSLGLDSEMRASYINSSIGIHLGDRLFPIAGITDTGFYGKGLEIEYHPNDQYWFLRAFSAEQHSSEISFNEDGSLTLANIKGIEAGYQFDSGLEIIANILSKENEDNSQHIETLTGFDVHWDKFDAFEVGLSFARDNDGHAIRFEQNGLLGALNYNLEFQRADALFDGQIKDVESESATGIYSFNENKSYLKANLFRSQRNLENDISRQIRDDNIYRLGIGHYFNDNRLDSLFAEVFVRTERDKREASDLDHTEKGIRLEYQKNINHQWGLNTNIEFARSHDDIKQLTSNIDRESLTLAYTPNDEYYFGFNIDNTHSIERNNQSLSYGLNAAIRLNNRQYFSGYWRHSDIANSNNDKFQLNYEHLFSNGLSLGLSVSTDTQPSRSGDVDYLLRLSMPLDIPLYKRKNISAIQGRVVDKEHHQAIANSIITIAGQHAISDEQGFYQFKAIRAGAYSIATDLSRTHLNQNYLIEDAQRNITLLADQTMIHNIQLTAGTGLTGQVRKYITSQSSVLQHIDEELIPSDGISGLLVTLISTEESEIVYKSLTTEGGFFSFNGIKAGKWHIQVADPQNLIGESRLDNPQRIVELQIGGELDLEFKAIPLLKKIKKIGPSTGFSVSGE